MRMNGIYPERQPIRVKYLERVDSKKGLKRLLAERWNSERREDRKEMNPSLFLKAEKNFNSLKRNECY
jgi:hypothetical protein